MTKTRRPITKWSVLALIVVFAGTALTLGSAHAWMFAWASSGKAFPIGQKSSIQLPPGESLVWYESPDRVPSGQVSLYLYDNNGDRVKPETLSGEINYNLTLGHKCGRALWKLNLARAGLYEATCNNHNFESDSMVPADDRVVFLKTPDSLAEMSFVSKVIQITGANITITLAFVFYLMHFVALRKRDRAHMRKLTTEHTESKEGVGS